MIARPVIPPVSDIKRVPVAQSGVPVGEHRPTTLSQNPPTQVLNVLNPQSKRRKSRMVHSRPSRVGGDPDASSPTRDHVSSLTAPSANDADVSQETPDAAATLNNAPLLATPPTAQDTLATAATMEATVVRFSQNFPIHTPTHHAPLRDTILLTGATGALGATLLGSLVPLARVARIFVLNRRSPTGVPLVQRQTEALVEAGYDAKRVLASPKVVMLESNMHEERLGLPLKLYEEIRRSITHIFHNAYLVNFNVPLTGFTPNITTLRLLIDLALSSPFPSPPRLLFVSTSDVWSQKPLLTGPVREELGPAQYATRGGYGQSKWVCENILAVASNQTPLRPIIARVGQISGGHNGAWNTHDWVPAMIRSSINFGCLPMLDHDVAWIPSYAVASAMIEMRNSAFMIHHLEHPRAVHWNSLMQPIGQALHLPLVPYPDWLARLERSAHAIKTPADVEEAKRENPAWSLIALFRRANTDRSKTPWRRAVGQAVFDMSHSLAVAPSLSQENLPALNGDDALKWLYFWRKAGILDWRVHASL
ncbi:hypothetical protein EIP91_008188 [Steccherinum ochraceum]|uniref:Thioester reductase (TE) domain-containing protein n=1 Tax=Steccherinum ochraceum TaxID=92696 RepID=A0A4R0R8V8_9APHY|nr:hypothetical protein EIP91_008188 [Steccherinum ochraceum]